MHDLHDGLDRAEAGARMRDIIEQLARIAEPMPNQDERAQTLWAARDKIVQLRNKLGVCVLGRKECEVTNETCSVCVTGGPDPIKPGEEL